MTSGRVISRTSWLRDRTGFLPGIANAHSGCSRYRSESSFIISGSIHIPNFRPFLFTCSIRLLRPHLILLSFTYQSPRPESSLFLFPNQPSSRTSISMPSEAASSARASIFSSSKSKYVASQLFIRTGLSASLYFPLHTLLRMNR